MKKALTSLIILFLTFSSTVAQMKHIAYSKSQSSQFLVVENKTGNYKPLKFRAGDAFTFRINTNPNKYKASLSHIGKDEITVFGTDIPLSAISWIQVDNKHWVVQQGSVYFPIASLGYFAMDMVNPIFSGEQSFQFSRQTLITSTSLMLTGMVLYLLRKKRYRIYKGLYTLKTQCR